MRQNPNEWFTQIFQEASKFSKMYFDTEIKIPRITNKQNYRNNYSSNSPEVYYKISVFLPCLDGFSYISKTVAVREYNLRGDLTFV